MHSLFTALNNILVGYCEALLYQAQHKRYLYLYQDEFQIPAQGLQNSPCHSSLAKFPM